MPLAARGLRSMLRRPALGGGCAALRFFSIDLRGGLTGPA